MRLTPARATSANMLSPVPLLLLWLLDQLDKKPSMGLEKVDEEPPDGGSRLSEQELTGRERRSTTDVVHGECDVVEN